MLGSMTTAAAFAGNGRLDVLSANQLGRALYAPLFQDQPNEEQPPRS
jgi:transcription regulator MmyB-like protein